MHAGTTERTYTQTLLPVHRYAELSRKSKSMAAQLMA